MVSSNELKALMALAGVEQSHIAKAMSCSIPMICKTINHPDKYPIKSMQIHLILTDWAKANGLAVVKAA